MNRITTVAVAALFLAVAGTAATAGTVNFTSTAARSSPSTLTFTTSDPTVTATVSGFTLDSSFTPTLTSILSNSAGVGIGSDSNIDPNEGLKISFSKSVQISSITFTGVDSSDVYATALVIGSTPSLGNIVTDSYSAFGSGASTRTLSLTNYTGGDLYIASFGGSFSLSGATFTPTGSVPLPAAILSAAPLLACTALRRPARK